MQRQRRIASSLAIVPFAAALWACGGSEPAQNAAPASNNANKVIVTNANANANANTATPTATASMTIPDDTKPLYTAKCAGCHGADAAGGPAAPNIFKVGDKHTADEWVAYLKNPKVWEKTNKMPAVKATDDEYKKLGAWLATATGHGGAGGENKANENKAGEKKS